MPSPDLRDLRGLTFEHLAPVNGIKIHTQTINRDMIMKDIWETDCERETGESITALVGEGGWQTLIF